MTEKVKLPKEVCDALGSIDRKVLDNSEIFRMSSGKLWVEQELYCLHRADKNLLMRALVLGYEPELTAEELMKEVYFLPYQPEAIPNTMEEAFKEGVRAALDIHEIHYDWMGDAE